mgnify:CR=1 FL=1
MDGGCSTPTRQIRKVQVHPAESRHVEDRRWDERTIGDHDSQVRVQSLNSITNRRVFEATRFDQGHSGFLCEAGDRGGDEAATAPGPCGRTRHDPNDLVVRVEEGLESGDGRGGCSREDYAHQASVTGRGRELRRAQGD